jgi:hypothetical protein
MKVEAIVDAERMRLGINGLLAFLLVTPAIYLLEHLIVFQGRSFAVLADAQAIISPERIVIALAAGLGIAIIVGNWKPSGQAEGNRRG